MTSPRHDSYSFVVKVWLEESVEEAGHAIWRGHVTDVFTGERKYIKDLSQVAEFIYPYLLRMGISPGLMQRFKMRCTAWRLHVGRRYVT